MAMSNRERVGRAFGNRPGDLIGFRRVGPVNPPRAFRWLDQRMLVNLTIRANGLHPIAALVEEHDLVANDAVARAGHRKIRLFAGQQIVQRQRIGLTGLSRLGDKCLQRRTGRRGRARLYRRQRQREDDQQQWQHDQAGAATRRTSSGSTAPEG